MVAVNLWGERNMNSKKAKKLKRIAIAMASGKPVSEVSKIYKRLKNTAKDKR